MSEETNNERHSITFYVNKDERINLEKALAIINYGNRSQAITEALNFYFEHIGLMEEDGSWIPTLEHKYQLKVIDTFDIIDELKERSLRHSDLNKLKAIIIRETEEKAAKVLDLRSESNCIGK